MPKVRLSNISSDVQEKYNIGPIVEADFSGEAVGGSFEIINREGETIVIDAVELFGTNIMVQRL